MTKPNRHDSVLVATSDRLLARQARHHLQQAGYQLNVPAMTGGDAVRRTLAEQPRVVLLDTVFEDGSDGIEAAAEIRRCAPSVPCIFLTTHADAMTVRRAGLVDPAGFIVVPFSPTQLTITVAMGAARARLLRDEADARASIAVAMRQLADSVSPLARDTSAVTRPAVLVAPGAGPLSLREREIIHLLLSGRHARDIAGTLGLSYHTVRNHLKRIYKKLRVHSLKGLSERVQADSIDLACLPRPAGMVRDTPLAPGSSGRDAGAHEPVRKMVSDDRPRRHF